MKLNIDQKLHRPPPYVFFLVVITLVGFLIRYIDIGSKSIWMDEGYSIWYSSQDWIYLWTEVPKFETHPVFYYSLLKLWRTFGSDEFTIRILSALINTATIPIVALCAYSCDPPRAKLQAVIAGILFTLSSTQIIASQDARPYALLSFSLALTLWSTTHIIIQSAGRVKGGGGARSKTASKIAFVGLGLGVGLLAWSHNVGPIIGACVGMCLLVWCLLKRDADARTLRRLVLSAALSLMIYSPNIPILLMQAQSVSERGFWLNTPTLYDLLMAALKMPLGHGGRFAMVLGSISLLLCAFGLLRIARSGSPHTDAGRYVAATLLVVAFAPAIATFAMSYLGPPVFLFRTLQASQVPLIVALAFAPTYFGNRIGLFASVATLATLCAATFYHFQNLQRWGRGGGEDWRSLASTIGRLSDTPHPTVLLFPNILEAPIAYYSEKMHISVNFMPIPDVFPTISPAHNHPNGNGGIPAFEPSMWRELSMKLETVDRIWWVARNPVLYDRTMFLEGSIKVMFPCVLHETATLSQLRSKKNDDGTCPQPI